VVGAEGEGHLEWLTIQNLKTGQTERVHSLLSQTQSSPLELLEYRATKNQPSAAIEASVVLTVR
jgi:hypothetical protein